MSNRITDQTRPQVEPEDDKSSGLNDAVLEDAGISEIDEYLAGEEENNLEGLNPKVREHLEKELKTNPLVAEATRKRHYLEELLPRRADLVGSVHQNGPTVETARIIKIISEIDKLIARQKDYEEAIFKIPARLVEPVSKILSRIEGLEPTDFGSRTQERVIDFFHKRYFEILGEMALVLPPQELLEQAIGPFTQPKRQEYQELFSQNEAAERVEDKADEIGLVIRQLILKSISEQDFSEIVEKSETLKELLDKCLNEIMVQEANKEMIKVWSEKDDYSLENLTLALREILEAEINKYDFYSDFLAAFITEKEIIELNKTGGLALLKPNSPKKTGHLEALFVRVPEKTLTSGYTPLATGLEALSLRERNIRKREKIITLAMKEFKRK